MTPGQHVFGDWSDWTDSETEGTEERERWCTTCQEHVEYQFRRRRRR